MMSRNFSLSSCGELVPLCGAVVPACGATFLAGTLFLYLFCADEGCANVSDELNIESDFIC